MPALRERQAYLGFPLQRGDDQRGPVRTNARGDGIVPAIEPLALECRLGPVLADHLDDATCAGELGLFHANRRMWEDRFEQRAIGGAVEDDLGLVRTGELLDHMVEPQVQKQIAVTRFDAAGKALPDQALALLAIQQAQQRCQVARWQRLVVREGCVRGKLGGPRLRICGRKRIDGQPERGGERQSFRVRCGFKLLIQQRSRQGALGRGRQHLGEPPHDGLGVRAAVRACHRGEIGAG